MVPSAGVMGGPPSSIAALSLQDGLLLALLLNGHLLVRYRPACDDNTDTDKGTIQHIYIAMWKRW